MIKTFVDQINPENFNLYIELADFDYKAAEETDNAFVPPSIPKL